MLPIELIAKGINRLNHKDIVNCCKLLKVYFLCIMTNSDKSRPSRFLVICSLCITLLSVVFYSVSFMRMTGELREQNKRILALEETQRKVKTDIPLSKPSTPGKIDLVRLQLSMSCSQNVSENSTMFV